MYFTPLNPRLICYSNRGNSSQIVGYHLFLQTLCQGWKLWTITQGKITQYDCASYPNVRVSWERLPRVRLHMIKLPKMKLPRIKSLCVRLPRARLPRKCNQSLIYVKTGYLWSDILHKIKTILHGQCPCVCDKFHVCWGRG